MTTTAPTSLDATDPTAGTEAATVTPAQAVAGKTLVELSTEVLETAVRTVVGRDDVPPRPGQLRLMQDLAVTFDATPEQGGGQLIGEAGTGVGKSLAYLTPAMSVAAARGERTVVSTESLSLQAQLIDKDCGLVADAVYAVTGYRPTFAVLKGHSNFTCAAAALESGKEALAAAGVTPTPPTGGAMTELVSVRDDLRTLIASGRALSVGDPDSAPLISWSINESLTGGTGDKFHYPGELADQRSWEKVSIASGDCLGKDKCPFADICLPDAAKQRAADADVIVTNHTLLGLQASKDIPVVLGSQRLGDIHHIVVDEGHQLASQVRSQGSVEVSQRRVAGVVAAVGRTLDEREASVSKLLTAGRVVADALGEELAGRNRQRNTVNRLGEDIDPLEETGDSARAWIKAAQTMVGTAQRAAAGGSRSVEIKLRRLAGRLEELDSAVKAVREHRPGVARWVETVEPSRGAYDPTPYPVVRYTPVDVAPLLRRNVWTVPVTEVDEAGEPVKYVGDPDERPRQPLNVALVSATFPNGFAVQVGVKATMQHYESPFDSAYGASALFVPRAVSDEDYAALANQWGKFDTNKHREWALAHMIDLIDANGGRALVIAANTTSGKHYAQQLRAAARGRWKVYSQWESSSVRAAVADWKADETSVLVGVKSLATGTDAPGRTASLIIVDRPARAASNPLDDARMEQIQQALEMDRWGADRLVYTADAAALLHQSAGRLIRSIDDSGMVAVLDPRLLKPSGSDFNYPEPTRKMYMNELDKFTIKISDPQTARDWLTNHQSEWDKRAAGKS